MKTASLIGRVSSIALKSISDATMNSNSIDIYSPYNKSKASASSPSVCDLSPVTNLTLNLSGLSTSVAGTPIRRISWSNPVAKGSRASSNLACSESPTFQEIFSRRNRTKHRVRKCILTIVPSDSEDDKENVAPLTECYDDSLAKKSDESMQCRSQDSGYSGLSEKLGLQSPLSPVFTKNKNIFSDDEDEDDFENIFEFEEMDDGDLLSPQPACMSSLLTKPISLHKSPHGSRYGRLPIRRCLSMEMDSESDSSSSESNSKMDTFVASCSGKNLANEVKNSTKSIFKRPEPPNNYFVSCNKRRKSSASVKSPSIDEISPGFVLKRSYSETAATIMHALLKADLQPELIGDGSRSYALPLCKGRHQDLKSITPDTLVGLLRGDFKSKIEYFTLVDCRYPYEFEGGHIQGARNIFTKEDILTTFIESYINSDQKNAIIFHCEFSSERAPTLCRFLRKKDREINEGHYPRLHHPEMYILEGGYKAFYESYKEFCQPQSYTPMNHKDHGFELRHFRAKSKSWGTDCKGRTKLRSNSKHTLI